VEKVFFESEMLMSVSPTSVGLALTSPFLFEIGWLLDIDMAVSGLRGIVVCALSL